MALKCGIVGLPNVGKSTLFNALTSAKALAANYPFATKEPNLGVITVPDKRLDQLSDIVRPQKVQPTTVEILDIAGLIKGASKGEGLGNQFLANIREVDAIIHVIRCFQDDNVVHVDGSINPVRDKDVIDTELQLKDIETLEKRLDKIQKAAKTGDKAAKATFDLGQRMLAHLGDGNNARSLDLTEEEALEIKEFQLLTGKPILYVCNVDEDSAVSGNEYSAAIKELVAAENAQVVIISAGIEADIAELETKEERLEFLEAIGLSEPGVNKIISAAYRLLGLITYFTAGEKEVRAWTITEGTKAPGAAGVIHTDFEKGFIRAEVIAYEDFISYGSEAAVKEAGKMGVEGKEYIVRDGDTMHFRFNV
ncbi:MAG TPA: redox-regulated ATPase YchF [Saprospiraceae bacterium]|nr:redox-regulated ATPase YchF [Saprospiraceae bacterium]